MGIQINGNTNNINAGIGSLSIEDIHELDLTGIATASNFKTGSSNLHSTGLTVGNSFVHSTGVNLGTGVTFSNSGDATFSGIVTATSFVGSGANLTGLPAGTTINTNADNRIITGSGTANTLNGEATLTYDGNTLQNLQSSNSSNLTLKATSNSFNSLILDSNRSANTQFAILDGRWNGNPVARIQYVTGGDGSNKDDGYMAFHTRESGSSLSERLRINQYGQVGINTSVGGQLAIAMDSSNTNPLATGFIALSLKNTNTTDNTSVCMDFNNSVGGIVGRFGAQFKDTSDKDTDLYFATRADGGVLTEALRITSTGQILIGAGAVATPKVTQAGSLDLDSGGISLCIGGNENSNGRTNSTNKLNRVVTPHYTNAEEPMAMISGYTSSGANELFYGGGSSLTNAATRHSFYTASGTTTTSGTERIRVVSNGQIIVGEANTSPVSDFEIRRANSGGDVSLRIGNNSGTNSGTTASLYFTTSPSQNFNTSYIQAKRDGGKLDFGYATNSPTVTMHVSNSNVGVNNTAPEGVGIDVTSSRSTAFSATADQRSLAHLILRNSSDAPGRFSSLSFVSGGGTQAEGSINLVQSGNYTGDMTFKMRNGSGSNDWIQAARFMSDGDFDFNKFEPDGTITTTLSSNSSSGNYTTIIPLNTSGIGHLHIYLVSIHWSFNSNGGVPYYCSGAVLWQTPHSNSNNGVNHPITMLSSCHVGGNYHLQIRNITHGSSYPGLQAANMNWTALAGSHYIVKYKRIY